MMLFLPACRVLVVRGAQYADCDGVYTMTNLSSVWDTKHIVYTRVGQPGRDQRYNIFIISLIECRESTECQMLL